MSVPRPTPYRETRARILLSPLSERAFVDREYARFLDRVADPARFTVVPLREITVVEPDGRVVLGLRHDVDVSLDSALRLGRLEAERGLRTTYYVLETAPYWQRPDLLDRLRELQALGHEIGWHTDLGTSALVLGQDPGELLGRELARLRAAGIDVVGAAAHGSPWCSRLGFRNNDVFSGWDDRDDGTAPTVELPKLRPEDFGLAYEAYHLPLDRYFSDSAAGADGRRWHPSQLPLDDLRAGERVVVLTHPCHWDATAAAKTMRVGRQTVERVLHGSRAPAPASGSAARETPGDG